MVYRRQSRHCKDYEVSGDPVDDDESPVDNDTRRSAREDCIRVGGCVVGCVIGKT